MARSAAGSDPSPITSGPHHCRCIRTRLEQSEPVSYGTHCLRASDPTGASTCMGRCRGQHMPDESHAHSRQARCSEASDRPVRNLATRIDDSHRMTRSRHHAHEVQESLDVRLQAGPGRRGRLRDRDRRARQGGRRAALPRRRHRGSDRPGLLRQRLGAAGRRQVRPRPAAGRAVPGAGALRRHPGRRAVRGGHAGAVLGPRPAAGHLRRAGPRGPRPGLGDRAVLRRPVRPRPRPAGRAAEGDRQGARRSSSAS